MTLRTSYPSELVDWIGFGYVGGHDSMLKGLSDHGQAPLSLNPPATWVFLDFFSLLASLTLTRMYAVVGFRHFTKASKERP